MTSKPDRLIAEMQAQGLTVRRGYVASMNDGDLEHNQTNADELCGLYVKNVSGKMAYVVYRTDGPLSEVLVMANDRLLETNIMDAFVCVFDDNNDEDY